MIKKKKEKSILEELIIMIEDDTKEAINTIKKGIENTKNTKPKVLNSKRQKPFVK